jgi:hypothetical protein
MQPARVPPIYLRQFQLVHEFQDEIVGRMQVLKRKIPVDGRFQFGCVDPFRNPCDLADTNEAPIAEDAREKRFFWRPGPGICDIPRLKGFDKAGESVDGREYFDQ